MSHLQQFSTQTHVRLRSLLATLVHRARNEAGEGVISAAIVVLIMALIGAAMWVAFNTVFTDASNRASDAVNRIGS